jgi:hypothetical protein
MITVFAVLGDLIPGANVFSWIAYFLLLLILSNMFLHKAWSQLQDGKARTTPARAVGLRFIPLFGYYWNFVAIQGLASDMNAYARERGITMQPASERLAFSYCLLLIVEGFLAWVPVLGSLSVIVDLVVFLLLFNNLRAACRVLADAKAQAGIESV